MSTSNTTRGRVLVCDDSMLMRKLVIDSLTEDGWTLAGEAQNGKEACDKYQELQPDAVTMDIVMPEHDGIYGLEQIIIHDPHAKVVMVSALNQTSLVAESVRKGAQDFMVKPFLPEQLQETMRRLVDANLQAQFQPIPFPVGKNRKILSTLVLRVWKIREESVGK